MIVAATPSDTGAVMVVLVFLILTRQAVGLSAIPVG